MAVAASHLHALVTQHTGKVVSAPAPKRSVPIKHHRHVEVGSKRHKHAECGARVAGMKQRRRAHERRSRPDLPSPVAVHHLNAELGKATTH